MKLTIHDLKPYIPLIRSEFSQALASEPLTNRAILARQSIYNPNRESGEGDFLNLSDAIAKSYFNNGSNPGLINFDLIDQGRLTNFAKKIYGEKKGAEIARDKDKIMEIIIWDAIAGAIEKDFILQSQQNIEDDLNAASKSYGQRSGADDIMSTNASNKDLINRVVISAIKDIVNPPSFTERFFNRTTLAIALGITAGFIALSVAGIVVAATSGAALALPAIVGGGVLALIAIHAGPAAVLATGASILSAAATTIGSAFGFISSKIKNLFGYRKPGITFNIDPFNKRNSKGKKGGTSDARLSRRMAATKPEDEVSRTHPAICEEDSTAVRESAAAAAANAGHQVATRPEPRQWLLPGDGKDVLENDDSGIDINDPFNPKPKAK